MHGRARLTGGLWIAVVLAVAACGGPPASGLPPSAGASTFAEFATEHCAALQSLFRAYGNPDTASLSPMMLTLEGALSRMDAPGAARAADDVRAELARGRDHARMAGGWAPGATGADQLDRLLVAMTMMVDAEQAGMEKGLSEAKGDGQAAFEASGGIDAWRGWMQAVGDAMKTAGVDHLPTCEGVPIR